MSTSGVSIYGWIFSVGTVRDTNIEIDIPPPAGGSDGKSLASIGEATIAAGESEIVVETTAVKDESKIFVTAGLCIQPATEHK